MISENARRINLALGLYTLLVVSITVLSWFIYIKYPAFYTRPIFAVSDQFRDLTNYNLKVAHLRGGSAALGSGFPIFTYPAPAAFVYKILLSVQMHPVGPYLAFLAIGVVGFAIAAWRASNADVASKESAGFVILFTALLGYPLWMAADRGNLEGVVWIICGAGLCFLLRAKYRIAALLIGTAASIKPFPILFLLLLVRRRRYKEAALGLATTVVITLTALTILGSNPWKAYQDLKPGMALYTERYVTNLPPMEEARFDHSLLDGMKSAALIAKTGSLVPDKVVAEAGEMGESQTIRLLARIYPMIAIAGFCLVFALFYKRPILNQLTALAVVIVLFPLSSSDYTLLHLYVPFGALVVFLTREVATGKVAFPYRSALAFAVIYGLLFSPLSFMTIYSADAKLLLLLALLFVAARSPMHSAYFEDESHA